MKQDYRIRLSSLLLTAFSLIALSLFSEAAAEEVFTWEDCVLEAIKNQPELISAAEEVKQAMSDKDIKASGLLPRIDADFSGSRTKTEAKSTSGGYNNKYTNSYTYGASGKQLLFDGFKTLDEVAGASKTINAQQYNYMVTSSDVRLGLRSAFAKLLKAQEFIPIAESIESRRKQNYELVKLRYEAGREHKGSLLAAEADLANAQFEIIQAKRDIILAQRQLTKEIGFTEFKQIKAEGEFTLLGTYKDKPDIEELVDGTPLLRELTAKKEAARFDVSSAEADFFPQIYINGSADRTADEWPPKRDGWSFGLSASLPLFEGGSRISEVSKAKSKLHQAEADRHSGRDSVLVTLERSWKDLKDSIEYVSVMRKFLIAAQERAKITRSQYAIGLSSFDDWIIIEDNLVSAEKAYLNSQADMLIAEAYWIQAIGGTLDYDEE